MPNQPEVARILSIVDNFTLSDVSKVEIRIDEKWSREATMSTTEPTCPTAGRPPTTPAPATGSAAPAAPITAIDESVTLLEQGAMQLKFEPEIVDAFLRIKANSVNTSKLLRSGVIARLDAIHRDIAYILRTLEWLIPDQYRAKMDQ